MRRSDIIQAFKMVYKYILLFMINIKIFSFFSISMLFPFLTVQTFQIGIKQNFRFHTCSGVIIDRHENQKLTHA